MGLISLSLLGLIKCWGGGGGGWLCKNILLHLKKCRGDHAEIFYGRGKNVVAGPNPVYFRGLIKCGGGGGMPKCFMDLKIPPDLKTTCS